MARFEPAERQQPQVVEDYTRWFLARLRAVEAAVAQSEYLCALGALRRPMWRWAMPCCWHNTWAWRRSLARPPKPIGSGCRRGPVTSGPWRRNCGRLWSKACPPRLRQTRSLEHTPHPTVLQSAQHVQTTHWHRRTGPVVHRRSPAATHGGGPAHAPWRHPAHAGDHPARAQSHRHPAGGRAWRVADISERVVQMGKAISSSGRGNCLPTRG